MDQHQAAAAARERRSDLRRLLEVRGLVGRHRAPHRDVSLITDDGVSLEATHLPGPGDDAPGVVLLHGFAARRTKPAYAFLADVLAGFAHVLSVDLRGHGDSGGVGTLGTDEWRDVAAAVAWLRRHGVSAIVPVGLSMGATASLHAAARGVDVDGVVSVSGADRHGRLDGSAMVALDGIWRNPWKRRGFQLLAGFRVVGPDDWTPSPDPVELAARSTVPLLIVHGEDDLYFPPEAAEALYEAAGGPAVLWREPAGFGHAEDGITPGFAVAVGRAVREVSATGAFPGRAAAWG